MPVTQSTKLPKQMTPLSFTNKRKSMKLKEEEDLERDVVVEKQDGSGLSLAGQGLKLAGQGKGRKKKSKKKCGC